MSVVWFDNEYSTRVKMGYRLKLLTIDIPQSNLSIFNGDRV